MEQIQHEEEDDGNKTIIKSPTKCHKERQGGDSPSPPRPIRHVADHDGHQEKVKESDPRRGVVKETVSAKFSMLEQMIQQSLHKLIMELFSVNSDAPKKTLTTMLDLVNLNSKAILPQARNIKALDEQLH